MWRQRVPPPCQEWRNLGVRPSHSLGFSFFLFELRGWTRRLPTPRQLVSAMAFYRIHFNVTNDSFREWNSRGWPWGTFVYSGSAAMEIWIPGVQAKFWNPERLCSIPRRCPSFHGLPSLAWDGRQRARPLYSGFVDILWLSLMGILTDMFDKHIPLIYVPRALVCG